MENSKLLKTIVTVLFILFIFAGCLINHPLDACRGFLSYLNPGGAVEETNTGYLESDYTSDIRGHDDFVDINGFAAKELKLNNLYSDMGLYVTDEKYILSAYPACEFDYEYEQTVGLRDFLKEHDINFLFVNEPVKYTDDSVMLKEFGVDSHINRDMDAFLKRIRSAGVPVVDLREGIKEDGLDVQGLFYRTDHHWTADTARWASARICEGLNKYCGYSIDTSIYDKDNYEMIEYHQSWLGEQGRKVGATYVGLEDYTEVKPRFQTDYTFKSSDGWYDGTFDNFIDESIYSSDKNVYDSKSWHYSYSQKNCINNNVDYGKVLILGDSFEQVTEPFMSLGVHELSSLVLRNSADDFSLRDYILKNGFDTVIVSYTESMLGAHMDPSSANYKMYSFDK